jgi:hypothetical protein
MIRRRQNQQHDRDRSGLLNRGEPGVGPDFREEPLPRPTRLSKPSPLHEGNPHGTNRGRQRKTGAGSPMTKSRKRIPVEALCASQPRRRTLWASDCDP